MKVGPYRHDHRARKGVPCLFGELVGKAEIYLGHGSSLHEPAKQARKGRSLAGEGLNAKRQQRCRSSFECTLKLVDVAGHGWKQGLRWMLIPLLHAQDHSAMDLFQESLIQLCGAHVRCIGYNESRKG